MFDELRSILKGAREHPGTGNIIVDQVGKTSRIAIAGNPIDRAERLKVNIGEEIGTARPKSGA
jgi:hypothetical protein